MFRKENVTVANIISLSRFVFLPLLYLFIVKDMKLAFLIGYIIIGSTDYFDGLVARHFNQQTEIGKLIDSFADIFFYLSSAYFMYKLYPTYLAPNRIMLIAFFVILASSFIISAIRCKKPMLLHSYILKLCGVLVYLLIIFSYFFNTTYFVSVILGLYYIGFIEEIIIFIKFGAVDPDTTSLYSLIRRKEI